MSTSLFIIIGFILFSGIIVFLIIYILDLERKALEIKRIISTRVFLVTIPKEGLVKTEGEPEPPKDYRQLISVAEQMFASFTHFYHRDIKNKITKDQEQISFEIISQGGLISFYIACSRKLEELIEKQIHAYYPSANIEKVKSPNIFKDIYGGGVFASKTMKLEKKFVLPIKTYMNLESDSLSSITNAMSKMGENSTCAYQLIIRPAGEEWRRSSMSASRKVLEGKSIYSDKILMKIFRGIVDFITDVFHDKNKDKPFPQNSENNQFQITPLQQATMKAIDDKASKNAFEATIRLVTVSPNDYQANSHLEQLASAFSQFGDPHINNFKTKKGDNQTIKDYILRRMTGKTSIMNTEELASVWHLPNQNINTPNIQWLMAKKMPPPVNIPQEGTVLGKSNYRGIEQIIKIKKEDRCRHIFMIGKTGVGKTTLFVNAFEQDIREGKGGCFIDPLGDAIEDILGKIPEERRNDVILFDPSDSEYPMGLNLLEYHTPEQRDFLIQETIQIFYKLFDPGQTGIVGPQWEHWFRNAALTIMNQPGGGTLIDIPRIFTDDAFRTKIVSYVTDPIVKNFWDQQLAKTADFHKSEMYNYFISKFGRFMTNDLMRNIIGQKKSSFDIRKIMDDGKILLINLSKGKIGEVNSALLGMIIVSKIQMAAFSRADIPEDERRDFYLYVDEFQNFTTDSFATILSEARKYHLSLNITNQYIAQLTEQIRDAVIGNAGTLISYLIGAADAEFMVKEFPGVTVGDFTNLNKFNTYCKLLIDGSPSKPFSMSGIKSETQSNPEVREQIKNFTRQNYARNVNDVNNEIISLLKATSAPEAGQNEPIKNI